MELLLISVGALFAGPAVVALAGKVRPVVQALDGFVLAALTGLVLLHVLPHAVLHGGWIAVGLAGIGLLAPYLLEGRLAYAHGALLGLALAGLGVHAFTDGAALALDDHGHGHSRLVLGVILHRLPLGMFLWFAVRPSMGARGALGIVALIAAATAGGQLAGDLVLAAASDSALAWFEALVAGSLLHVVLHHGAPALGHDHGHDHGGHDHSGHGHSDHDPDHGHSGHDHGHGPGHAHGHADHGHDHDHGPSHGHSHGHDHDHAGGEANWGGALGALAGVGLLWALSHVHQLNPEVGELDAASTFVTLSLESAPALLLAFVGAGLLQAFLDPAGMGWLQRGGPLGQAGKGIAFGLPLPVCSCGVLPLYESLSRSGMPAAAALAFLVATPELGLDAILISLPLLGPELTVARLVAAAITALVAALVVRRFILPLTATASQLPQQRPPLGARLRAGLRFGLGELVDHTLPWVLVGLAVAALVEPTLDGRWLGSLSGWLQVPLFALVGAPVYVCASGATPFVAVLLHKGISPGAAIAFLLTGPATNATTFGVLGKLHGRRAAVAFAVTVTVAATGLGYLTNFALGDHPPMPLHDVADAAANPLQVASLIALSLLFLASLVRQGPRGVVRQITDAVHVH